MTQSNSDVADTVLSTMRDMREQMDAQAERIRKLEQALDIAKQRAALIDKKINNTITLEELLLLDRLNSIAEEPTQPNF